MIGWFLMIFYRILVNMESVPHSALLDLKKNKVASLTQENKLLLPDEIERL